MRGHFVYLAVTPDGRYYCGYSVDVAARLRAHNAGRGAKILRGNRPVRLAYRRRFATRSEALRYESALKRRTHAHKHALADAWLLRRRPRSV